LHDHEIGGIFTNNGFKEIGSKKSTGFLYQVEELLERLLRHCFTFTFIRSGVQPFIRKFSSSGRRRFFHIGGRE